MTAEVGFIGGQVIRIKCETWAVTIRDGVITGYEFKGLDGQVVLTIAHISYVRDV